MNKSFPKRLCRACLLWVGLLMMPLGAGAQRDFRIMTYNVENLFDTLQSHRYEDADFTPAGSHRWNTSRYWKKLGQLERVIAAAGGASPVDVVGLVEVEHAGVVNDLLKNTSLARLGYDFRITCGKDARGINVALLFQPERFRPYHVQHLHFDVPHNEPALRDALLVEGVVPTGDSLSLFLVHFPSRRGGVAASELRRRKAAQGLRCAIDSVMRQRPEAKLVVMGDFNATIADDCLCRTLGVDTIGTQAGFSDKDLVEASSMERRNASVEGTYYYQGYWDMIDHIFVGRSMLREDSGLKVSAGGWQIFDHPMLLEWRRSYEQQVCVPFRTYLGPHYHGGISDHLPLILHLTLDYKATF